MLKKILPILTIEICSTLVFLCFVALLTNSLSAEEYGDYASAYSFVYFVFLILLIGSDALSLKEISPSYDSNDSKGIRTQFVYFLIVILATSLCLYSCIGIYFLYTPTSIYHPIFIISFFAPAFAFAYLSYCILIAFKKPILASLLYSFFIPLSMLIAVYLAIKGGYLHDSETAVVFVGSMWSVITILLIYKTISKTEVFGSINKIKWKPSLKLGITSMLFSIGNWSLTDISVVLSEVFLSNESHVGVFSVVVVITVLYRKIIGRVIFTLLSPELAILIKANDIKALKNMLFKSYLILGAITIVLTLIISYFSKAILSFYGLEYIIGSNSLVIMLLAQSITITFSLCTPTINFYAKNRFILVNSLMLIISIIFLSFFFSGYGIQGLSIAYLITIVLVYSSQIFYIHRILLKEQSAICNS